MWSCVLRGKCDPFLIQGAADRDLVLSYEENTEVYDNAKEFIQMCLCELKHSVHCKARGKEHCCWVCQMKTVARSVTAICAVPCVKV